MNIEIIKKRPNAIIPAYQSEGAAGFDLHACLSKTVTVWSNSSPIMIPTGIAIAIRDPNYVGILVPRSSWGHKKGLVLGNSVGIIDSDYNGEIMISASCRRDGENPEGFDINPNDRIAQLLIMPVARVTFTEVEKFSEATLRGEGGFGSTDLQKVG